MFLLVHLIRYLCNVKLTIKQVYAISIFPLVSERHEMIYCYNFFFAEDVSVVSKNTFDT